MNKKTYYLKPYKEKLCGLLLGVIFSILTIVVYSLGVVFNIINIDDILWPLGLIAIFLITPLFDLFYSIFMESSSFEKITLENGYLELFARRNQIEYGSMTKKFKIEKIKKIEIKFERFFCFEYINLELNSSLIIINLVELHAKDYHKIKEYLLSNIDK